jgi:HlyD family secretion protein
MLLFIVPAAAAAAIGTYAAQRFLRASAAELEPITVRLQQHRFSIVIAASGELQSAESLAVAVPPVPVNRLRIGSVVPDGRHVAKGESVLEFDPTELDLEAREHRSTLEMAEHKIERSELAIAVEKSDIVKDRRVAELELERLQEFLPKDAAIYSAREIVEAQINKVYTEKRIVFAEARLQLKGKVYTLDEAILMLERQQANTKIGQVEKALASLTLLAPASGIVVYNDPGYFSGDARLMPGRVVWRGMTLFNLVNPDLMEAKCFVLEKDAGELRIGQTVAVSLDPFPGSSFSGKVKSIDKLARPIDRDSPVKYFQTIISMDRTDRAVMKPGVKVKARITAGDIADAIVVPRSAVVRKDGSQIVYVRRGARFEPVAVTLGAGDLIQVVVKDGLRPGDVLALNPPDVKVDFVSGAKKAKS